MIKKNLKLNSLSRYSKQSPQLVLEEHSSCEVPAGCGGVVLRWINPHKIIPLQMRLYTNGDAELFLDGKSPSSSRPLLPYGEHILAIRISQPQPGFGLLMFIGFSDQKKGVDDDGGEPVNILSQPDGTWKYSLTEPDKDSWLYPEFDDSNWTQMVAKALPIPGNGDDDYWKRNEFEELKKLGAQELGTKDKEVGDTVWIRKAFILSIPEK